MSIPTSYLVAAGFTAAVVGWMLSGDIVTGGRSDARPETIFERNTQAEQTLFKVETTVFAAKPRLRQIEVRGSTLASNKVSIRSETTGMVAKRHVRKGGRVEVGDLICSLSVGDREARVAEEQAELKRAEIELNAALDLNSNGFATRARINENRASLDAAKAQMKGAEIELKRTEIRAPISGIVQDPFAKVGDMLQLGDVCAEIIDPQSMVMVAQVSERHISHLSIGSVADVRVITGEDVQGKIKFIAPSADTETRTFRIEIALPNEDGRLREGVTSVAKITLPSDDAHLLPASALTLNDAGVTGVKMTNDEDVVQFQPVTVLEDSRKGIWVSGLPQAAKLITRGQEYVVVGQKVDPVTKTAEISSGTAQ